MSETKKESLYELLTQSQSISDMIRQSGGELGSGIEDAMELLEAKIPAKVEGYASLIQSAELMAQSFLQKEEQFKQARKLCESFAEQLEKRLKDLMMEKGFERLDGESVYYRLSKPTFKLVTDPLLRPEDLPKEYVETVVTLNVKKKEIEKDLKDGKQIAGCTLGTTQSLRKYPMGGGK